MSVEDLDLLTPDWQRLATMAPNQAPFFQPYWFKALARTFAAERPLQLLVVTGGGVVHGILPLMYQDNFFGRVPARTLGSLSSNHSFRFDLICDPESSSAVASAAWECLRGHKRWTVLEMRTVPQDGAFKSIMNHAAQDGFPTVWWPNLMSPYLTLPAQGRDPFENSPARYRSDRKRLKKYEGRLREVGEISFEVTRDFSEALFQEFLRLEGAGWKGQNGGAIRCNPVVTQFYREVLREAAQEGHLRLCSLSAGQRRVAMELAFVVGNQCFSPKIAYDEELSRCAPGQLLAREAIADLVNRGVKLYDLLGARARHKSLWAGEERAHGNAYIFRPTIRGALCHFVADSIAPRVKKMKHSIYGDPQGVKS
jgi:CelD/BcsL family acetyltransferase involved in cellulose biosynthesis